MSKKVKLKPLNDRIWVERDKEDSYERTSSGLFLGTQVNENVSKGTVIAVGTGRRVDGVLIPFSVNPGDRIVFSKRAVTEFADSGIEFVTVKEADIITILEHEEE